MQIKVSIDAAKYQRWLQDAPEKITEAMSNVIKIVSFAIEREAKIKAPVDTGRLRSSIATDLRPLMATIQPHVNYALFVHEGTRHMRGRPFMTDAVELIERQIPALVDNELKRLL